MVKAWAPGFDPLRDDIVTTPVWVRLSNIPVNFYHRSILMGIASGLGKPIKVDLTKLNFERARVARLCGGEFEEAIKVYNDDQWGEILCIIRRAYEYLLVMWSVWTYGACMSSGRSGENG